jgi:hypothetical protein
MDSEFIVKIWPNRRVGARQKYAPRAADPPSRPRHRQLSVIDGEGVPGWQITLIAIGAALLAAALAVFPDRARAVRRRVNTTSA